MDVLIPAVEAYTSELEKGAEMNEALLKMKNAADKGMNSTKDLIAKIGRSSRLGERSRGVLDAGAVSCNLILQSFADTVLEIAR
jgi:dihydroxyacetone kinase-like protein